MNDTKNNTIPAALPTARGALYLTQEQEWAASLWEIKDTEEIAAAISIPSHVLTEWQDQPLFIAEITDHCLEIGASTEEKQAATLVFDNFSYAEAEATLGLGEGTIMKWAQEDESPFNKLVEEMRCDFAISTIEPEITDKIQNDSDSHDLSEDQMLAIPLIIEGKTDAQVGEAIGKSRETINRWRNQNQDFIRALKQARETHFDSQIMALSATTRKAITTLENLLDSEDEKIRMQVALHLLKETALPKRIG